MAEHRFLLPDELDIASAQQVRADLKAAVARGGDLLIDCSRLTFIDSSGVAVLLEANQNLERDGWHFALVNVRDQPRQTLHWLGLDDLVRPDREVST
jgi:anti-sigma B factor antagonist